jgi:hypothetical protein
MPQRGVQPAVVVESQPVNHCVLRFSAGGKLLPKSPPAFKLDYQTTTPCPQLCAVGIESVFNVW